jgi:hypothetical protein
MGSELLTIFLPLLIPFCLYYFVHAKIAKGKRLATFLASICWLAVGIAALCLLKIDFGIFLNIAALALLMLALLHVLIVVVVILSGKIFNVIAIRIRSNEPFSKALAPMSTSNEAVENSTHEWWASQRQRFNVILLIAAPSSLVSFLVVAFAFESRLSCLEFSVFTFIFGAIIFLLGLLAANVFYYLGPLVEWLSRTRHAMVLRKRLFGAGTAFSVLLIFSPVLVVLVIAFSGRPTTSCHDSVVEYVGQPSERDNTVFRRGVREDLVRRVRHDLNMWV